MFGGKPWLCFSGGNTLGAYHAGAYQALHEHGIEPGRIAGASIGAVTGALIAGNPRDQRLARLKAFWEMASDLSVPLLGASNKRWSALQALLTGRPGLFRPSFPGMMSALPFPVRDVSLLDTRPQRDTLQRLIDFHRLKSNEVPLLVTAINAESGEDVVFDSRKIEIEVDHLMASTALPIVFPPVVIGDQTFFDPGLSANLPLRPLFAQEPDADVVCICFDLFSARGHLHASLEGVVGRMTDLIFASQTRHALTDFKNRFSRSDGPHITIIHVPYRDEAKEIGLKTFDYSRTSINARWEAGYRNSRRLIEAAEGLSRRARMDLYHLDPAGDLVFLG
jgi:NTE family protein